MPSPLVKPVITSIYEVAGQRILKLMIETKGVPGSVVKKKAQEAADQLKEIFETSK